MSAAPLPEQCVVVFDLDDTLYDEREFVRSGFRAVSRIVEQETGVRVDERLEALFDAKHGDPLGTVINELSLPIDKLRLLAAYRNHRPELKLDRSVTQLLDTLCSTGRLLGIMTDGRSITQRNKISALGLDKWSPAILISEEFGTAKPAEANYRHFEERFAPRRCVFIGNDLTKEFVTPNRLGWQTHCVLDNGRHIRTQHFDRLPEIAWPQYLLERLAW